MPTLTRRKATFLLTPALAIVVAACSAGGGTASSAPPDGPSTAPSEAPSASPNADTIDHPTGATDIVLRYEEGGGFMMAGFAAAMVPHFTLYGDGTIVYRDPTLPYPAPVGSITRANPMRTAMLTEEQIQDVLAVALGEGGLATARPEYRYDMISDASTALFTIQASGLTKTVSVYALGIDDPNMPDLVTRTALSALATKLTTIEQGGAIAASDYAPAAYRGVLFESPGLIAPDAIVWPWPDIAPADFAPDADPNGLQFPHRTMTIEEVEALRIDDYTGGLQNVPLTGPDGKTYQFTLRPLLPDETA